MRSFVPLIGCLVWVSGCGETAPPGPASWSYADSAGLRVIEIPLHTADTAKIEKLRDFAEPTGGFGFVHDASVGAEGIAVIDRQSDGLVWYDRAGRVRSQMGRAGDGPGEFRTAEKVEVFPACIVVFDRRRHRFIRFDHAGAFFGESPADPGWRYAAPSCDTSSQVGARSIDDGVARRVGGDATIHGTVVRVERQTPEDTTFLWSGAGTESLEYGTMSVGSPLVTLPSFAIDARRIGFTSGQIPELMIWAGTGERTLVRFVGWDATVPDRLWDSLATWYLERGDARSAPIFEILFDERARPDWRPFAGTVQLSDDGGIWLQEAGPNRKVGPRAYHLDLAQESFTTFLVPAKARLLDAVGDTVLLRLESDLGVHTLAQYQLRR
ncbi:MAG: hypothetical protein RQ751_09255 [Longimicrobiales bacterium]|nr:hypothetical protein [Longimicrobiales bacterium]